MPTPGQHIFSEKVALVTDGASPVGRAISMQLGLYGCYVISALKDPSESEKDAVNELESLGTLAYSVDADLSDLEGAAKLIDRIDSIYGRLDLLVNCLAAKPGPGFAACLEADFDSAVSAVLRPAYFLSREAMRLFEGRPKARIVNVVTYRQDSGDGSGMLVSALNASVASLTSSMAEHFPAKYRINTIAVKEKSVSSREEEELDPDLFRGRSSIAPDDVARAVVFLLSAEAKAVNGQVLEVG